MPRGAPHACTCRMQIMCSCLSYPLLRSEAVWHPFLVPTPPTCTRATCRSVTPNVLHMHCALPQLSNRTRRRMLMCAAPSCSRKFRS